MSVFYSHILAASENNVIGVANDLPWALPKDMEFFKSTTKGHIIIMGRKTFDSFHGRLLPKREHIVITRDPSAYLTEFKKKYAELFQDAKFVNSFEQNVFFVQSLQEAYEIAEQHQIEKNYPAEIFIIGGGEIYKQSLQDVKRIYLTRIHKDFQGDTKYPVLPSQQFRVISEKKESDGDISYTFFLYERIS